MGLYVLLGSEFMLLGSHGAGHELTEAGLYKNLSYAYVSSGLANGCFLYE